MKKRILALVLTVALAVGLVVEAGMPLPVNAAATVTEGRVSDANTTGTYQDAFGLEGNSTRYSGRVWTDKTVYTGDAEFNGTVDGRPQTFRVTNDSDFLVAYSALATSTSVSGKMKAPVDVVLVIDNSGSMVDNGYLDNTVEAVNNSIKALMAMNEYNRVAVVLYDTDVATLLPLGRYTSSTQGKGNYIGYDIEEGWLSETVYFYNTVNQSVNYNNPFNGNRIDRSKCLNTDSDRGTNIQLGVYTGLNILAEARDTTVEIDGKKVQRIPALVLLSDGAATYSYSGTNWWEPGTSVQGPGSSAYYGNGMLAMATAQYMKQQVTKHYTGNINESVYATKIYTVGMGVTSLRGDNRELAYLTLDPKNYWDSGMGRSTQSAFNTYLQEQSVDIKVDSSGWNDNGTYNMKHPGADDITTLEYTNAYYDAANADDVVKVFEDIMGDISVSAPEVPTEVAPGEDPVENGYITYTDTIGKYMEVKDVKEILWSGVQFNERSKVTEGNVTTYTFRGTIDSPVYNKQNLSDVIITVRDNEDETQTLTIQIPASAIPLRVNTIKLNANNQVEENSNNGAYPIRVFYDVGMKDGVIDENGKVNPQAVSQEYLDKNTNPDGTVNFYSNLYTGKKGTLPGHTDKTVGDANVTFEPADTNPYYFNQEQVPLYTDSDCTIQATWPVNLSGTYYRDVTYYEGKVQHTEHVKITTGAYQQKDFVEVDGKLYLEKGTYRVRNLASFVGEKEDSLTSTAQTYYYPTYNEDASGNTNGSFTVYLGNNGVLSAPMATGSLTLSKQVEGAGADRTTPFTFTVTLEDVNGKPLTGSYPYVGGVLQNVEGVTAPEAGNLVLDDQGTGTVTLTHGQTITVRGLPVDATFTVSEAEANQGGYTTTVSVNNVASETGVATGTVGQSSTVAFTNTRAVGSLNVTKMVTGDMGDKSHPFAFSVTLKNANGEPMTGSVTYTKSDKDGEPVKDSLDLTAGVGTFTLTDGQSATFDSLPVGTQYSVTETEADQNGYTTTVEAVPSATVSEEDEDVVSGTIVADGATTVTYTNYRGLTPPTDVSDPGSVYQVMLGVGGICALTIVGCSFLVWRRRRRDWM